MDSEESSRKIIRQNSSLGTPTNGEPSLLQRAVALQTTWTTPFSITALFHQHNESKKRTVRPEDELTFTKTQDGYFEKFSQRLLELPHL